MKSPEWLQIFYCHNVAAEIRALAQESGYEYAHIWGEYYKRCERDYAAWVEVVEIDKSYDVWKDSPNDAFFQAVANCSPTETAFLKAFLQVIGRTDIEPSSIQINAYKAALDAYWDKHGIRTRDKALAKIVCYDLDSEIKRLMNIVGECLYLAGRKVSDLCDYVNDEDVPNPIYFDLVDKLAETQKAYELLKGNENV